MFGDMFGDMFGGIFTLTPNIPHDELSQAILARRLRDTRHLLPHPHETP
jgi:hypothetical protein